jgi:hypothetical protein
MASSYTKGLIDPSTRSKGLIRPNINDMQLVEDTFAPSQRTKARVVKVNVIVSGAMDKVSIGTEYIRFWLTNPLHHVTSYRVAQCHLFPFNMAANYCAMNICEPTLSSSWIQCGVRTANGPQQVIAIIPRSAAATSGYSLQEPIATPCEVQKLDHLDLKFLNAAGLNCNAAITEYMIRFEFESVLFDDGPSSKMQ